VFVEETEHKRAETALFWLKMETMRRVGYDIELMAGSGGFHRGDWCHVFSRQDRGKMRIRHTGGMDWVCRQKRHQREVGPEVVWRVIRSD